jgi:ribulose-phosphate 3-epimerase
MKDLQPTTYNLQPVIYLGADHAGFEMKEALRSFLHDHGYEVMDCGNTKFEAQDDYPDFGFAVGRSVAGDPGSRGIVFCGSGVGMCLSANKVAGVRAACTLGEGHAQSGKRDDDTNILCIASRSVSLEEVERIVLAWLETEFVEEERFVRRVQKVNRYERSEAIRTIKNFSQIKVIPAILEEEISAVYKKLALVEGTTDWVQIDVMDGKFVPGKSFDISALDTARYPFFYEAHLMTSDPLAYVERCARVGIDRVIFHWEAVKGVQEARELCTAIVQKGMSAGVAINPETDIQEIRDVVGYVDEVLILGVHPGKSGQEMLPGTIERIQSVRAICPARVAIGVDGGVTKDNRRACLSAGATRVVSGSMIFQEKNILI